MKLVYLCCRRWRLLDGNLHLSQTPSTVFWWGRWAHGRCHVMVTWYRFPPLHSPTAWNGTRAWTRSEHCSTLPLTHTTEIASQLSFYLSEKHLTIVSQFALPCHLHITVYVCIAFTQPDVYCINPTWFFFSLEILMMMVKQRPRAINHYCSFLKQLHAWKELISVYQLVL